ncbi:TadE/TadG family type IV pilus assembly protein [Caldalkalibacillus mannanilyticus]|uniref:TadE/TadG family type IV pilus assembly protein n=1 Tax=Caldalkalibacillus mannanilyticus TaxID=1418 RepID=UPI0004683E72|nr:TadE family protein [Caldalkalibacillus mannanilyticus]
MSKRRLSFCRKVTGSIVLEAAIILPIFLCFMLFLTTLIRISIVDMALTQALSSGVKQVATQIYPVGVSMTQIKDPEKESTLTALYPTKSQKVLELREAFVQGTGAADRAILDNVFQPLFDTYIDDTVLRIENFQITQASLPNLRNRSEAYLAVEARYDMPLYLPFFNQTMTFKKKAVERVWIGETQAPLPTDMDPNRPSEKNKKERDSHKQEDEGAEDGSTEKQDPDSSDIDSEEGVSKEPPPQEEIEEEDCFYLDSINSPVQRGKKVKILACGPPNQSILVTLEYQSGFVKSESCPTNAEGWMSCEIIIGGNSKEGAYEAILTLDEQEARGGFEVLSKASMEAYIKKRLDKKRGH